MQAQIKDQIGVIQQKQISQQSAENKAQLCTPENKVQGTSNTIMARLINLAGAALKADSFEKSANIIVNQIHTLTKTDRAVLVPLSGKKRILCISGDLEPTQDNPFSQAVHEIRTYFHPFILRGEREAQILSVEHLPTEFGNAPNARKVLETMGGTHILWLPLMPEWSKKGYALWLERWNNTPWNPEETRLISHAAVFFEHALCLPRKKRSASLSKKSAIGIVLILFFLLMWLPVYSRINAPAQVVPDHPYYVFAPFDGIVEELAVQPGESVKKEDMIFRYDTRVLKKQLEETQRGVSVARAELARLEGAAYSDEDARAKIPVQKLEVERKQAEVAFLQTQLERSDVKTDSEGVVVLDDPDALIGASLQTGELVLSVADPSQTKLRIMVPVTDAGLLQKGNQVIVRLDSDPLHAIHARIERIGFDVRMSETHIPSILTEAVWDGNAMVTPGQRGMARIQGTRVFLGLQLFRKPLISLRNLFGI